MATQTQNLSGRRIGGLQAGFITVIVANVATVVGFLLLRSVFGISFIMPIQPGAAPTPLAIPQVVIVTTLAAVIATLLFSLIARRSPRPWRTFGIVAAVAFALMLVPPLLLPDTDTSTRLGLEVLHIVAAVAIVGSLRAQFGARR